MLQPLPHSLQDKATGDTPHDPGEGESRHREILSWPVQPSRPAAEAQRVASRRTRTSHGYLSKSVPLLPSFFFPLSVSRATTMPGCEARDERVVHTAYSCVSAMRDVVCGGGGLEGRESVRWREAQEGETACVSTGGRNSEVVSIYNYYSYRDNNPPHIV